MSNKNEDHQWDKLGLFILAGLVVLVLGGIVAGTYITKTVPDKSDVLLGTITTGLILFLRDLVAAVRAGWEEVTRGKVNDQLAKASPPAANDVAEDAPTGAEGDPLHTVEEKPLKEAKK